TRGGDASAHRQIATSPVTADTGDLDRALIARHVIGLMRIGRGIIAGDRNVDRHVDYDGSIHQRPEEVPVATVAGAIIAGIDQVGPGPGGDVPTRCNVVVTTVAPIAGYLNGTLIDIHIVRLVGMGAGIGPRHRDIDRMIKYE